MTKQDVEMLNVLRPRPRESDVLPALVARIDALPAQERDELFHRFHQQCGLEFGDDLIYALQAIEERERR